MEFDRNSHGNERNVQQQLLSNSNSQNNGAATSFSMENANLVSSAFLFSGGAPATTGSSNGLRSVGGGPDPVARFQVTSGPQNGNQSQLAMSTGTWIVGGDSVDSVGAGGLMLPRNVVGQPQQQHAPSVVYLNCNYNPEIQSGFAEQSEFCFVFCLQVFFFQNELNKVCFR